MAQSPKQGIPPAPPVDPNAGKNIHGQPNIPGEGPKPNMAPPSNETEGVSDNTRAEMEAGRRNLQQYAHRDDAEHEAGQDLVRQYSGKK